MGWETEEIASRKVEDEAFLAVRKTRGILGGEACIRDTRHTVSGLVQWRRLGLTDPQILARHPDLSQSDLDMASAYDDQNREEIDRAIRDDEEA